MIKKVFLSFIVMTLGVITINAQGAINLTDLTFEPGETKMLSIELNDETAYCGFQMDVALPEGFSVAEVVNEDGELVKDITLDAARKASSHIIESNEITGAIRILSYSSKNAVYKGTSGALVNISVKASEEIAAGSYSVQVKNIEFTTPDEEATRFNNAFATFEVESTVIDIVKGEIILNNLTFEAGETKTFSIELNDENAYCGFQMDVVLPDGFSVAEVVNEDGELVKDITLDAARKASSHIIESNEITGAIRILSYSSKNAVYKGTSGALVNISVKASEEIAAGSYSVQVKNIEFTTPDEVATRFDNVFATFEAKQMPSGYTAVVNCAPEGTAMLSATYVNKGNPLKLLIAPNDGYKVLSLLLNGNAVNVKNNTYSIASVTENIVFDVAFEAIKPDTVLVEKIDSVIIEKTDTMVVEKIDSVIIEKIDTMVVEKIDSVIIEKIDTMVVEKIDSVIIEKTDTMVVDKIVTDTIEIEKIVTDTIEIEKIVTDTIEIEKIVTDTIEIEKIVTDTIEIEKIVTDTIEIETIETDTIYIAEINEVPTPEISVANDTVTLSCALQGARILYSIDGTFPTNEYTAPIAIKENCVIMAIAVVASETTYKEIIHTGIGGGIADEIVSCRYFTETGIELDEPCEGINIMIIKYASGKTETKKVVVRRK